MASIAAAADSSCAAALARGRVYALLAELLSLPAAPPPAVPEARASPIDMVKALAALPYELECPGDLIAQQDFTGLQSEFIRLFELNITGPPCVLYGGAYTADRQATMEELLRFYRYFGLTVNGACNADLPDSMATVLEFMQFLCVSESMSHAADDATSVRLAERDILSRHLTLWAPKVLERIRQLAPRPFYVGVLVLMNRFCLADLAYLEY